MIYRHKGEHIFEHILQTYFEHVFGIRYKVQYRFEITTQSRKSILYCLKFVVIPDSRDRDRPNRDSTENLHT